MPLTRISFHSLPVDDQDRALAFYRDRLGLSVQVDAPMGEDWRWIFLMLPGGNRIHFARRSEIDVAGGTPALALVSTDVDADCAAWSDAGVEIVSPPQDAPWQPGVRWATIRDSEGNILFVESLKGDTQ